MLKLMVWSCNCTEGLIVKLLLSVVVDVEVGQLDRVMSIVKSSLTRINVETVI